MIISDPDRRVEMRKFANDRSHQKASEQDSSNITRKPGQEINTRKSQNNLSDVERKQLALAEPHTIQDQGTRQLMFTNPDGPTAQLTRRAARSP